MLLRNLTRWDRVTHIRIGDLAIIGSGNACRLIGTKPFSEPILPCCQSDAKEYISVKFHQIRKSKDYVYGIWVYKVLGIWKGYYRVNKKSLVSCMNFILFIEENAFKMSATAHVVFML